MVPPDDILGILPIWVGVYLALGVSLALSGYVFYRRVISLILLGRAENRFDQPLKRLLGLLTVVLGQRLVLQRFSLKDKAGIGHALIFWGFLSFLLSYIVLIFGDSLWAPFSEKLLTSTGVKVFTSYLDIVALIILSALTWALFRRWMAKPHRLTFDLTRSPDAVIIVSLIGSLMVLTVLTEAFFVASGGTGPHGLALVGNAMGEWFQDLGLSQGAASAAQEGTWWLHYGVILGFSVYIPFSKHMHMVAAPLNAYTRSLKPRGALPSIDLESAESFGGGRVQDFTWKELLDGYACAVCGRCTDSCPANLSGKVLSPMHIVEYMKEHLTKVGAQVKAGQDPQDNMPLIGGLIPEEAIWDCVTCGACVQECPVVVDHVPSIIDMRRYLVMEKSSIPETGKNALISLEQRGHPWRGTTFTRTDWAQGLDVPTIAENPEAEVLLWVGCTPALEQRSQGVARSFAKVLKAAGVDFAILGDEEQCTGDPARRMGNEYLFQVLAKGNIETFKRHNIKKIVALCPHCFNTIKNEYPQFDGHFEVMHYAELLSELVREGRIKTLVPVEEKVAYHDPCYLGRYNGVYDPPREVARAIPGLQLVEMERNRERSFCCGAGGGHMWMEESRGTRINHVRTDHFLETDADTIAASCPFCLQMFTEGIQSKGYEGKKKAKDLVEVLAESMGLNETEGAEPQTQQGT